MPKNLLKGLSLILGALFLYGCTSTKNVEVRRYVEIRDRVDQQMEGGNAGFIMGTPQPEDRSGIRKTRKVYVVEVSTSEELDDEDVIVESNDGMDQSGFRGEDFDYRTPPRTETMRARDDMDTMMGWEDIDTAKPVSRSPASVVEYTIQKDDTLQKISKKFYDSYSQWNKIYEYNKDVIGDPDRIKPGTVIRIPAK